VTRYILFDIDTDTKKYPENIITQYTQYSIGRNRIPTSELLSAHRRHIIMYNNCSLHLFYIHMRSGMHAAHSVVR